MSGRMNYDTGQTPDYYPGDVDDEPAWIAAVHVAAVLADLCAEHEAQAMFDKPLDELTKAEAETLTAFLDECGRY